MIDSASTQIVRPQRRRAAFLKVGVAAATLAFAASFAAIALAASSTVTIGTASNSTLGEQVLVSSQSRTLYVLSPETASHLLCKSSECLTFWPPVTVPSSKTKLKAGAGVHGHLGILRRSNGTLQLTINGLPLYRFSQDHASDEANGQNFKSFGGTWHVLSGSGSPSSKAPASATPSAPAPAAPAPAPAPSSPSTGYGY